MKKTKTKAAASAVRKSSKAAPAKVTLPNLKLADGNDGLRQALEILRDSSQTPVIMTMGISRRRGSDLISVRVSRPLRRGISMSM